MNKLEILNRLSLNIINWLSGLTKRYNFSKFGWNFALLCHLWKNYVFPVSVGPTNNIKTGISVEFNFFSVLVMVKCTRCTTQESYPKSWFVTHLWKLISPKDTKDIQQNHNKNGTETKFSIWNRFVPNKITIFFFGQYYLLDLSSVSYAQFLNNENWKKTLNHSKVLFT